MIIEKMKVSGYLYTLRKDFPPPYMMFMKAYTPAGFQGQCYHIHIAPQSHKGLWDRLNFRDYLIAKPAVAAEYEALKLDLALKHKNDREAYTDGKSEFVKRITNVAKNSYR